MTTDERILVLMPTIRDGGRTQHALADAGLDCAVCADLAQLCQEMDHGAGLALVTEEIVAADRNGLLKKSLRNQPHWSDFPLVVLVREGAENRDLRELMNTTLVERPVKFRSLISVLRAALRSRRHQYAIRDHLAERKEAETKLARLAAIVESSEDAIISKTLEGIILSWNAGAQRLFGYSASEAVGRSVTMLIPPDRLDEERKILEQLGRGERIEPFETIRVAKGGRLINISLSISPVRDENGHVVAASKVARDITARYRAEGELRDIRSRMEAALAAGAIGTWAWDIPGDRFYGDSSLARIFSLSPEAVAGGPIGRVIEAIHPDDQARVTDLVNRAIRSGGRYEADYRVMQSNGSWRWVTARGQVERDAEGRAVRFPGVVMDETERKIAEVALARLTEQSERQKRLYETILSGTPDFVYVFSLDHRVIYANDALLTMWGRNLKETIGKTFLDIGYEDWHAEMHCREIDQVRATKKSIRGEVPFTGTNGRRIYDYIFVPVIGSSGEVEAVAGTTRDITDRQAMEQELRDADRKKDDFIALLAHELRNPLAPIRNGLQVLRLAQGNVAVTEPAREMMDRQLSHMVRLIDDLLDISRINRNKMELRRTRIALTDVVSAAVETARPAIDSGRHELEISLPQSPVFLDADLTRLAQVFSNLLTNSAKYTQPGGRIFLTAERRGNEVVVSVRDTGIGIPPESLGTIFDMFSQVDRSIERSAGGLGIGLALVKGLVEVHGGAVTAASNTEGSTFTVTLPVIAAEPQSAQRSSPGNEPPKTSRRILVVDDNQDGAISLATMLRLTGNEVQTANDGLAAIEQAEAFRPEIILMDIGMPRLNGLDATRQIRKFPWGKNVKIIALTGWGQEVAKMESREAGCDGHLVKPVGLSDLEKLLERDRWQQCRVELQDARAVAHRGEQ